MKLRRIIRPMENTLPIKRQSKMAEAQEVEMAGPSNQGNEDVPRRIVVDANSPNVEVVSSETVQVPPETEKKIKVILFVAHAHKKILLHFFPKDPDYNDLSLGDQIHNILFTAYTILRQTHNQTGGTLESRISGTDFKITYDGNEYTRPRGPIMDLVLAEAMAQGIPFAKYDQRDPNNWYGIANPVLNYLSGFALRRNELRLGHRFMPIGGKNNQQKDVNLAQYGIYDVHHPLCEGISFPPEKRASMSQTVGPLTALLCYLKADSRYSQKWANAVKRAFAHFPDIDTVMQILKEREPAEVRTLITLISDVALIATTGQACRMFPPPAAFSYIFTREQHKCGSSTFNTRDLLPLLDFYDHGAFAFYKIFMYTSWKLALNNGTESIAKQICYHSMFGTYKEDLGILAQITNQSTWNTREEMGEVFRKNNTEGTIITFEPVRQKFYSKLSQESQTSLLLSSRLSSTSCCSSKSKRKFDDVFFDHLLLVSEKNRTSGRKPLHVLVNSYVMLRKELINMLQANNKTLEIGTTTWRRLDVTPTSHGTEEPDMVVHATGKCFLGKS